MATKRQAFESTARRSAEAATSTAVGGAFTFKNFVKKFYNDWTFHQAQAMAFGLITAMVPLAILLLAIVGWILGGLDHQAYNQVVNHVANSLPKEFATQQALSSAANKLRSASAGLAILAVITSLFFGSRLFTLMEACFDLIYHVPPRSQGKKNLMAIIMTVVSVVLIPVLVLASVIPGQVVAFLQHTAINPNSSATYNVVGIISSLVVSFILFVVFYAVVPNNQGLARTRIRTSWRGAAVAAVLLQIFLLLFPLYVRLFTNGYVGQLAFALVLLVFFYLVAVAILLGAQVNAFFVKHIGPYNADLITRSSRS